MVNFYNILMKYTSRNSFLDVLEFLKDNKIIYLHFIKNRKIPLKFKYKNIKGGNFYKRNIDISNKYNVLIDEYNDIIDENIKIINFIKLNAELDKNNEYNENEHCAVIIIDKKRKKANIQSINNYNDCVKCIENNNDYKIGDILMKIIIMICKENNLKEINLTDNSYLLCYDVKIPLIILRTMTIGEPYYCKFGFIPKYKEEYEVLKKNKKTYLSKPELSKEELIKLFMYKKFDENNKNDRKMLSFINKLLIPRLLPNNNVSEILKMIIDYKMIIGCRIILNIYNKLYERLNYSIYEKKEFYLKL